jgi:hypothetical protein
MSAINETLHIQEFAEQPERLPLHVDYHEYTADSSSAAATSFRIDSPGSGALMDSEAWIKYTAVVALGGLRNQFLSGPLINTLLPAAGGLVGIEDQNCFAFRQGYPFQRCMQSISLNINGTTLVNRPDRYTDQVLRAYNMPQEVVTMCSGAGGGHFDTGLGIPRPHTDNTATGLSGVGDSISQVCGPTGSQLFAGVAGTTGYIQRAYNDDDEFDLNSGFGKRIMWARKDWRSSGTDVLPAGDAVAYPLTHDFIIWERVPIAPFLNYESRDEKRSIPHINQMTLNLNWNSQLHTAGGNNNKVSMLLQTKISRAAGENMSIALSVDYYTKAPRLYLKWYIPPMGFKIPPQISIPIYDYQFFSTPSKPPDITIAVGASKSDILPFTYNNIRLEQLPDLLYIWVGHNPTTSPAYCPSEMQGEIVDLSISLDGDAGKMLNAQGIDLYSMWVRNSNKREKFTEGYIQWKKHYSIALLRPEDMGVRFSPGIRNPVTLNITGHVRYWQKSQPIATHAGNTGNFGTIDWVNNNGNNYASLAAAVVTKGGAEFRVNVLCEYHKYRLTLTEAGGSRRELQSIPKADSNISIQQAAPQTSGLQDIF